MIRKLFIFITLTISVIFVSAQTFSQQREGNRPYTVSYTQPQPGVHQITFEILNVSVDDVTLGGTTYSRIHLGNVPVIEKKGWAELPFVSASIQLPNNRDVEMEVSSPNAVSIQLQNPMVPSRGVIYRNQDPNSIPYEIAPESRTSELYPADIATMESPFIVRDVRGTTVRVLPFRYNGATQTLEYYRTITVTLRETNHPATNPLTRTDLRTNREAVGMYRSLFLNYEPTRQDLAQGEKGDILVLTPSAYEGAADLYIQWKKEMGYNVTKQVVNSGANVATTIQNEYNSNGNLMYVQLFGDWADIKSNTITVDYASAPTDPRMGCVAGNDNYPDIAIGRFSCSTNAQALVQVNKAINYEKNPNMEAGWRETFIGIGSNEGSGQGDDNEIDYVHVQRIFSERLQPFTYITERANYHINSSPSASTLAGHVNAGASTIAYCGHGAETQFVTTGFNNNNVNATTNGDKLPFIVSVACVNGEFTQSGDCFAEAWLKKENGGAVVTLMSTINQPWTPPQRGQDYFYDILVGGFDYNQYSGQNGINTNEQRTHWGSIVVNAFTLALSESSQSDDLETFRTWTTFGDASLQLRTKQPDVLALSSRNLMSGVPFTTTVTVNNEPVADALVCISQNDNYYSAYTDANGSVSIPQDFSVGDVLLVVTAFNTTTIYETINCTASDVPYLTLTDYTPEIVSAGETPFLSLSMSNLGGIATDDYATVTLTCNDPLLSVTDGTGYAEPMAALTGTCTMTNEFQVSIDESTETGHIFTLNWTAAFENYSWDGTITLTAIGSNCVAPEGLAVTDNGNNAVLTWNDESTEEQISLTDDVEGHTYGTINSPGAIGWTYIDGDGANTGSFQNIEYTNEGSPMAYIVLDQSQMSGNANTVQGHSGNKFFGSAYAKSSGWGGSTVQNDDWMISPELNFTEPFTFSFWARSYSSSYSSEQFYAAYSTTGTAASDFTNLNSSATTTTVTWTEYTYTVPANAKYVAIHCVSNDQYIFCVDDITISGRVINGPSCNIYRNGELIAEHVAGGTFTDSNLPEGTYCYTLTRDCGSGFESSMSESVCVTIGNPVSEPCDAPTGLTAATSSSQIGLSWNAVENAIAYKVYRNGNVIATTQTNSYTDANVTDGTTYAYAVKTVCTGGESGLSNTVNGMTGINSYDGSEIRIYPNPAHNVLNIEGDNLKEASLYSAIGTLVQKTEVNGKTVTLNVSNLTKGIYFVRIMTNEGNISTRKVVVE
jgi:gingipain R